MEREFIDFDPVKHEAILRTLTTAYLEESAPSLERELGVSEDIPAMVDDDMKHLEQFTPPTGRLLMVVDGDHIVGTGRLRPIAPGAAEIKRMYVLPQARGRGLGRQLLSQLIEVARHEGYREVRLDTHPSVNPSAFELYCAAGFEPMGPYPESEIPDEWRDRWVFMRLQLTNS